MVSLVHNKPIRKGNLSPKNRQNKKHILKDKNTGRFIDRSINSYRLWFLYLKLCLELEETGWVFEKLGKEKLSKPRVTRGKRGGVRSSPNPFDWKTFKWKVKVDRHQYKGWDLDKVLTQSFDKWWNPHKHLFENQQPPEIVKSPNTLKKLSPHQRLILIDERNGYTKSIKEIEVLLSDLKRDKTQESGVSSSEFTINGKPQEKSLNLGRNILIRWVNWKGLSDEKWMKDLILKERDRIGENFKIEPDLKTLRRKRYETQDILIGVCLGDFVDPITIESMEFEEDEV